MASLLSELTYNQGNELLSRLARAGLTVEQARSLLADPDLVAQWVKSFPMSVMTADNLPSFKVTVDYTLDLVAMIAAGKYDWTNNDITAKNFPIKGKGSVEIELLLVHLNRYATTKEVEAEMGKRGLRAATIAELLALGAAHPELQRGFLIVALGSRCVLDDDGSVPVLYGSDDGRALDLYHDDSEWDVRCRFLAVRK